MTEVSEEDVRVALFMATCGRGKITKLGTEIGVGQRAVSDMRNGRRGISKRVAEHIGFHAEIGVGRYAERHYYRAQG